MIKYVFQVTIIILIVVQSSQAQVSRNEVTVLDEFTNPGGMLDELRSPPPRTEGTTYIFDEWFKGTIYFKKGTILRDHKLKYDLDNNLLEIDSKYGIKVCPLILVKRFELKTEPNSTVNYVNLSTIKDRNDHLPVGVAQVLFDEGVQLLEYPYIYVKEPTYVAQLDMGHKNKKILIKKKKYIITPYGISEIKEAKKKIPPLFKDKQEVVEKYVQQNGLNLKKNEDLIKLVEYYDSLM